MKIKIGIAQFSAFGPESEPRENGIYCLRCDTIKERMTLDTSGHYQRRGIFSFDINRKRN